MVMQTHELRLWLTAAPRIQTDTLHKPTLWRWRCDSGGEANVNVPEWSSNVRRSVLTCKALKKYFGFQILLLFYEAKVMLNENKNESRMVFLLI